MNLFKRRRPTLAVVESRQAQRGQTAAVVPNVCARAFVRGQGSWLWDDRGHACLDFDQAGAMNSLGHSPPVLVNALGAQAQALINPGRHFASAPAQALIQRLCQATGSDQAWVLDSSAQACEDALRLAREWGRRHRGGAEGIITAGRTRGTGLSQVPFNDLAALHAQVDSRTVAIMLEPLQADAGVIPATRDYLLGAEQLCRELGILLILDETLTGSGRCGALLAEQTYGVRADIVILGSGLGSGVPLAALLARGTALCTEACATPIRQADNALMSAAGLAVLDTLLAPGFFDQVQDSGRHLRDGLSRVARRYSHGEVRGQGLLWALHLREAQAQALVEAALGEGLLLAAVKPDVVRFSPALDVSRGNIDDMLQRLARSFAHLQPRQQRFGEAFG